MRFDAIVLHFHNKHKHCGVWCKYRDDPELTKTEGEIKYKKFESEEYFAIKTIHEKFTTDEKLTEINHLFSSQKNESMNMLITKFAPKNVTYCRTLSLKERVSFAVCVDSIGYAATIAYITRCIGVDLKYPMAISWEAEDQLRKKNKEYQQTSEFKTRRNMKWRERHYENRRLEAITNKEGNTYSTGIAIEVTKTVTVKKRKASRITISPICDDCGNKGHKTKYNMKCKLNNGEKK
jgi:hypothetical protein